MRYCYGKHCHDRNKKCKTGKLITYKKKSECFFESVVKYWRRKVCCATAKKCIENKCKTIKKHCKVTNIRDRTSAGEKLIELKKRVFENERSKRLKKT